MRGSLALLVCAMLSRGFGAQPVLDVDTTARAYQPGELVVVALSVDQDAADVTVSAFGRAAPAFRETDGRWQAIVGIDLDQAPGPASIEAAARVSGVAVTAARAIAIAPKTFATRTLKVDPDFVNPPAAVRARIEREAELLKGVYAASATERLWRPPFLPPVPHRANSRFGARSIFNGEPRSQHAGTDFLSPAGTPVRAPNAGRVVVARPLYFSGNTVIVDHGAGVFSMLAHLSRIDVKEGTAVKPGVIVGLVGATGRVTGAHLHWGFRVGGARVDPLSALALLGSKAAGEAGR
jgi:murein DD-endopeptidase MepM/ murein hydrolase activator NlpD